MRQKWFLQMWFIALLIALWPIYGIPLIAGIILIIFRYRDEKKLLDKYGDYETITQKIISLDNEYQSKKIALQSDYENLNKTLREKLIDEESLLKHRLQKAKEELRITQKELELFKTETTVMNYSFSDYDGITSEECKNKLSLIKNEEKELIKLGKALYIFSEGSRKEINDNSKQILRCFNTECDNTLVNLSVKNIDSMRKKITTSYESLNKIFAIDGISLNKELLEYKLEELNLVYTYELKKEQEKEQQKAIKEQMLEEEKVRREIEKEKAKIEKDQAQCSNEINKLMSYLQKTANDIEKQLYIDKIKDLESKLKQLELQKVNVLEREANAKAGFVYIISNIGSFGENVYKIGMTRRLEPMDRIKELSSASVPFEFDVHAMIFSDDAPTLENTLHKLFEKNSVNRVNLRKEFFNVTIDEIETVVKERFNKTVIFTKVPIAKEYLQTLNIIQSEESA